MLKLRKFILLVFLCFKTVLEKNISEKSLFRRQMIIFVQRWTPFLAEHSRIETASSAYRLQDSQSSRPFRFLILRACRAGQSGRLESLRRENISRLL